MRAASPEVVISQVYGGGGNASAAFRNDFIELFNRSSSPVSLNGWSVQYGSATGAFASSTNLTNVTLQPGQYYLIQEASGGTNGAILPAPDATGSINMSATSGKVALVNTATVLNCGSATGTACNASQLATIVDLIGYGSTSGSPASEGSPAPALDNTKAALRKSGGCSDTDNNLADFDPGTPNPRNTTSPLAPCGSTNQPIVPTCGGPLNVDQGTAISWRVSATDADGTVVKVEATNVTPSPAPSNISITSFTAAEGVGGTLVGALTVEATVPANSYSVTLTFTNNDDPTPQTATCTLTVNVLAPVTLTPIYTIQGAARSSPLIGQSLTTEGVVTGIKSNGFFMQDPTGDGDNATSDGIFVFTSSAPNVTTGHRVRVAGIVSEFTGSPAYQPLTELGGGPNVWDLGAGATIAPLIISTDPARTGPNIRKPPAVIYSASGYDPNVNGLDFYESLEGMLVEVDNARVVGLTSQFGEIPVIPDNGTGATGLTSRGTIAISATDFNPERLFIDDEIIPGGNPKLSVGDSIGGAITGPLDYTFGNYKLQTLSVLSGVDTSKRPAQETTSPATNPNLFRVATYNIENFSRLGADASRVITIANHIATNLAAPDLLLLEEVQDDTGPTNDATVTADQNLIALRDAIVAAGGPTYSFRYINPVDNQDGGQPGGNIRQVFFYRTDRGLSFVAKGSAGPTDANAVNPDGSLTLSPGRIDPTNAAFSDSRKPLAAEFSLNGRRLIAIANHFNSRGGDSPLYGATQPPDLSTEPKRRDQATIVRDFVTSILTADPEAFVIVGGDLNEFEFGRPLNILKNGEGALTGSKVITDALESPALASERYTYIFEGNAQSIDHLLYSQALANRFISSDIVHINADYLPTFSGKASDHDPLVATFCGNPFLVNVGDDNNTCGTLSYALQKASSGQKITIQSGTTITLTGTTPLPALQEGVSLDGGCTTDPAGRGIPGALINAAGISGPQTQALLKLSNNNTLNGLKLVGYVDYAVEIGGTNNTLTCNWIGTPDGTTKKANGGGIRFKNVASNNDIGKTGDLKSGNLVSGNSGYGILDSATDGVNNRFYYNLVGLDKNGLLPLRNGSALKAAGGAHFWFGPGNRFF